MSGDSDSTAQAPGCPAHGAAGPATDGLLDRPLPAGYREEWARHFAEVEPMADDGRDGAEQTVVLFRIGEEWLALSTALFLEVTAPRRYHSLPHRRDNRVLGIVNVRGELVVCVSLAALLGIAEAGQAQPESTARAFARLAVIGHDGRRTAFPVDEVHGVHRYGRADIAEVPASIGRAATSFTAQLIVWAGRTVGRLNDDLILDALDRSVA